MPDNPFVFFLSYARADRERDPAIERFFTDLSNAVAALLGRTGRTGFLDTSDIEPGDSWSPKLEETLGSCGAFVPVLSPTYFSRPNCGREWTAFDRRLTQVSPGLSGRPQLIQPVLLFPSLDLDPMPQAVAAIQNVNDAYPKAYRDLGLSDLAGLTGENDNYVRFYKAFAKKLVAAFRKHPLPEVAIPPLESLPNAFHKPGTQLQDIAPTAAPGKRLFVRFIYAAGRRQDFESLERELVFHGDAGGYDWQPFMPDLDAEVNMLATELAGRKRYRYEAAPFDGQYIKSIKDAVRENKIVVVVIDPWTARLPRYANLMSQLDETRFLTCVVVIPWNPTERKTAACREKLEQAIGAAFYTTMLKPDHETFVPWVGSAQRFEDELAARLDAMRARIINRQQRVLKAEATGEYTALPVVVGTRVP